MFLAKAALSCGVLVLALLGTVRADDKPRDKDASAEAIRQLIRQLGDDDPAVRDRATKRLTEIGKAAVPALRDAAKSTDLEIRTRSQRILAAVEGAADRNAREAVDQYLAKLKARNAQVAGLNFESVAEAFPEHAFVAVRFRQFPVAMLPPKPLKSQNLFIVKKNGQLEHLTDSKELEAFFRSSLAPAKDEKAAKNAVKAWLLLAQEFANDGFFQFIIPEDTLSAEKEKGGVKATGKAQVKAGGTGEIHVAMVFDDTGKLTKLAEERKLKAGVRPICQATKLLDPDPIVRRMAEQDIVVMGSAAAEYLAEQRAKASPELRQAIDYIWRRILAEER